MNKRTIKIAVKLFLSIFLLTLLSGKSSGAVKYSGDDLKITDSSSDIPAGNPGDKTSKSNLDENRDSGTKDIKQSNEPKISSYQPSVGTFSIQIAAFNDEENASVFVDNNKELLNGYNLFYSNSGELYKVLIGHFNSIEEASYQLREVYDLGYDDTFITELSRQKN